MARKHKNPTHDIVIVGDGLAGLVMALSLAKANIACTLIGPQMAVADDGRTTAIMQDGIDYLDRLGVWNSDTLHAVPLRTMRLISQDATIAFPSSDLALPQFGFNIANAALKDSLLRHIAASHRISYVKTSVTGMTVPQTSDTQQVQLICANKNEFMARLVIAADGRNSLVRDAAAITVAHTALDQAALVCVVDTERPHDFTSTEWYHSGGPFTLVPMRDQQMGVVYCDTQDNITALAASTPDDLSAYFTGFSNGVYGDVRVVTRPQIWPVMPQHSHTMVAAHVALIGEAAHVMPPLAAQGFNTSLRDIQALQGVLTEAVALGLDIGHVSVLKKYDAQRGLDMRMRGTGVNWLNTLIRRDDAVGRTLHSWGFKTLTRLTPLKKLLMRAALAPRPERIVA